MNSTHKTSPSSTIDPVTVGIEAYRRAWLFEILGRRSWNLYQHVVMNEIYLRSNKNPSLWWQILMDVNGLE